MINLIFMTIALLLSACSSTVDMHMPVTRFDTPETSGDLFQGSIAADYHGVNKLVMVKDADTSNPQFNQSHIENSHAIGISGALGLWERLDFELKSSGDSPSMYGAKIQFLGGTGRGAKGFKASILGAFGLSKKDEINHSGSSLFSPSKSSNTARLYLERHDYVLAFGYRRDENKMVYANVFYSKYLINGGVKIGGNDPETKFKGRGQNFGAALGLQYRHGKFNEQRDQGTFFNLEANYAKSTYSKTREHARGTASIIAGYFF